MFNWVLLETVVKNLKKTLTTPILSNKIKKCKFALKTKIKGGKTNLLNPGYVISLILLSMHMKKAIYKLLDPFKRKIVIFESVDKQFKKIYDLYNLSKLKIVSLS